MTYALAPPTTFRSSGRLNAEEVVALTVQKHVTVQVDGLEPLAQQTRSAPTVVFQAKLRPLVRQGYLLPRPRLHALLEAAVTAPLTLVVAPAGTGKTSLLRSWAADTALPLAWLSLDEEDRDPQQLWRGVLAALEGVAPGCTTAVAGLLGRPEGLPEAVSALLDDLEARDYESKVLVIDDVQLIDEDHAVDSLLAVFVQHLPAWLHVVAASRREPRLPVHRLRARGLLGEVRFPELRFTVDEGSSMLSHLAPALELDVVAEVAGRADGWAAGIQLAALAARAAEAQAQPFRPDHDDDLLYLEDYVWREVLAGESDELVDVLMTVAVASQVDAELAQVLTGRPDAADLLTLAEERGLFVSRVEPTGFELHPRVRDVLLTGLAKRSPAELVELDAVAAGWHEAHGLTAPALEHWLRADRPREALRLLAAQALALSDDGQAGTIERTLGALPDSVATGGLDARIEYAWSHLLVDRRCFVHLVDGLARSIRDDLDVGAVRAARVEVLQAIAATLRGHWADGGSLARSALQGFGDTWWLDQVGQFAWNMVARDLALSECWDDATHESREVVRALAVMPERSLALEGTRTLGEALAGRPVDALRLAAGARDRCEAANLTTARNEIQIAEAIAHRELGDSATAVPLLLGLADVRSESLPHCRLLALLELTQARLDEGDHYAATEAFLAAAELVDADMPGPGAHTWLATCGARLAIAAGDLEEARGWSAQVRDPFWSPMCAARVHLATDDAGLAAHALGAAEPRSVRHRVLLDLVQFRSRGGTDEAEAHLVEAVRVSAGHGLVQTVASEGRGVVEAVERLAWRAPRAWLDRLRRAGQPEGQKLPGTRPGVPLEALTERELAVLRMLPSRLTLREIADELSISINTLKFHLKVIYRKLGCSSRAEAAEVARSLTGLHRPGQSGQPSYSNRPRSG
ncbi:MAG TPA: LuxR C-terminal-related transcriptional regulator [Nocardioides sp.]|nr:LuxR C-terminal-related transcriptional regulator [Nocardioides sp.]